MATTVFLVRHGEVENPDNMVYGALPGFGLSERGQEQAEAAASRLAGADVDAVVASPLQRAQRTAGIIAQRHRLHVHPDDRLLEWGLALRWQGHRWDELEVAFPGELAQYLARSWDLPFSPESLAECAARVAEAACDWGHAHERAIVVVGHQDPLQAARLKLTARPAAEQRHDLLGHGAIIELTPTAGTWIERSSWEPDQEG